MLLTLDARYGGRLVNFTQHGARLELDRSPRVGARALLTWFDHDAVGRIVWANGSACGIEFEDRVAMNKVREVLASQFIPDGRVSVRPGPP
ncbi:MAG: hypothetical protein KGN34_02580 [Sphingomonadales bacterium]|nr:hypothetical protein [Sphingomonadales bacterium]